VTQECITHGVSASLSSCPVALGLKAAGFSRPKVFGGSMAFDKEGTDNDRVYVTHDKVGEFVGAFDNGLPVKPFNFYVTIKETK
jgi:hypothetical protein